MASHEDRPPPVTHHLGHRHRSCSHRHLGVCCTISGNTSGKGGGLSAKQTAAISMTNCVVANNTAGGGGVVNPWGGGAFADRDGTFTIVNCTFTGNSAAKGGGYAQYDASASP